MPTFDLKEEPWIPVVHEDGSIQEMGLREALLHAHKLRAICDPMPIVEFGLYRLLTAFALDIFAPSDIYALHDLLNAGKFNQGKVEGYFTAHADRFDLFHIEHPFLQTAGMDAEAEKPLASLLPTVPSGTNALHFHHARETDFGVLPSVVARILTTIAPFMTAGGSGLSPSINGAPPWYVLISGPNSTLFVTLCLNCCVLPLPYLTDNAPPAWRSNSPLLPERRTHASLLESLTWQPRRIQLLVDGPGICSLTGIVAPALVRTMKFTAGASCDFSWTDPSVAYRIDDKGPTPLRPREGREIWRDTGPLALLNQKDSQTQDGKYRFNRPILVNQFADLIKLEPSARSGKLALTIYGMRTDKNKVFEWQRETLELPKPLILNQQFQISAQGAMDKADSVSSALQKVIKGVYPRDGKSNKRAFDTLIAQAQRQFWADLRVYYDCYLDELAPLSPEEDDKQLDTARVNWEERLRVIGRQSLNEAIDGLDTDADALKRRVNARKTFARALNRLFATQGQKRTRQAPNKRSAKSQSLS